MDLNGPWKLILVDSQCLVMLLHIKLKLELKKISTMDCGNLMWIFLFYLISKSWKLTILKFVQNQYKHHPHYLGNV